VFVIGWLFLVVVVFAFDLVVYVHKKKLYSKARIDSSFFFFVILSFFISEDACARVSCNYGTCINEDTSYRCECQRGYEGAACDRQIDPCASFVCYHGGVCHVQQNNEPVCQCAHGYRGANCYEADGTFAENHLARGIVSHETKKNYLHVDFSSFFLSSNRRLS